MRRVVITGMGIWSCLGTDIDTVRQSLYEGKSGIGLKSERLEYGYRSGLTGIIMMQNNFVAPNINFENPDEYSEKLNLTAKTVDTEVNTVLSNSFGFGGTNSALVIRTLNIER